VSRWERFRRILRHEPLPAALIDLDAVDANAATLRCAAGGTPIRLATKSLRVPWLYRYLLAKDGFAGLMTWSAHEVARLSDLGFDDFVLAYPPSRADEVEMLRRVHADGRRVMTLIDDPAHVSLLHGTGLTVGLDVDGSWRPAGLHVGVRRSPLRTPDQARALARAAVAAGLRVEGLMCYEAQIAGLRDRSGSPVVDAVKRWLKARSQPHVARTRAEVRAALEGDGHRLRLVNGGGTGSIRTTTTDGTVTEVTAGSGLLAPHLFDGYDGLSLVPAAFFAISVSRRSDDGYCTAAGGGVIASGETGKDRSPVVWAPDHLTPLSREGWGEVQTPFRSLGGATPNIGEPIIARPAKSGEWLERFNEVLIVRGDRIIERAPTVRGYGWAFF
jgi:D-serine deaminase-like pyridoxal phosphate-dependent protein